MGLFDKDKSKQQQPQPQPAPTGTQETDKIEEIRKISGFNSLDEVAQTAQDVIRDSAKRSADKKRISPKQKEEMEALAKAEQRKRALETLGRFLCREVSVVPYDVWSRFYNDPSLRLSEAEAEKLTEATFLVVQGFDVDFSSPWIGLAGLTLLHGAMIGTRIKQQMESGAIGGDKEIREAKEEIEKIQ